MRLSKPRVVIIGAGFGGLEAAKNIDNSDFEVIVIEKTNHHLFQPLLYQVATAALSPGDIATPVRSILRGQKNVQVIMNEVTSIDKENQLVKMEDDSLYFDYLILAPGSRHSYFGNDNWEKHAPGLKTLEDALTIRERILVAFEQAERSYHTKDYHKHLNFVIVGGGPTGVELAGAIAEITEKTMLPDFPVIRKEDVNIYLIEANKDVLGPYTDNLRKYTYETLQKMGVNVLLETMVSEIGDGYVETSSGKLNSSNIIWAAGNEASPLLKTLNCELDKGGRAVVNNDLTIKEYKNIFVIGDAANYSDDEGNPLPAVAQVAMQQARYVAKVISEKLSPDERQKFKYTDKGSMATIGKAKAVAMFKGQNVSGWFAWLIWSVVHIFYIIGFRNRFRVMIEWFWYYITQKPGARLIIKNKPGETIKRQSKEKDVPISNKQT